MSSYQIFDITLVGFGGPIPSEACMVATPISQNGPGLSPRTAGPGPGHYLVIPAPAKIPIPVGYWCLQCVWIKSYIAQYLKMRYLSAYSFGLSESKNWALCLYLNVYIVFKF